MKAGANIPRTWQLITKLICSVENARACIASGVAAMTRFIDP